MHIVSKETPFLQVLVTRKSQHSLGLYEVVHPYQKEPFPFITGTGTNDYLWRLLAYDCACWPPAPSVSHDLALLTALQTSAAPELRPPSYSSPL